MEAKRRTVRSLVTKLGSVSEQKRAEALAELRLLSKNDAESRPIISDSGAIPYLAEILYSYSHASQENAAATLLNLSITSRDSLMSTRGRLDAIAHALRHHSTSTSADAVQSSAATLHSLLVVDSYRPIIGAKRDIIHSLIDIIRTRSSPPRSVKDSLKALFGIALYPLNRQQIIALGGVQPLFSMIVNEGRVGLVEDASAVIAQIAGCEESLDEFKSCSGIGVLVDLLDLGTGSSHRVKENAVSALLNLANFGGERAAKEVKEMGMEAVDGVADVAQNGSAKGKAKAVALLKILDDDGSMVRDSHFDSLLDQSQSF